MVEARLSLAVTRIAGTLFAVEARRVAAVTNVPYGGAADTVPFSDLAEILGLDPPAGPAPRRLLQLVGRTPEERGELRLAVGTQVDIRAVDLSELFGPPIMLARPMAACSLVGIARHGTELAFLIDVDALERAITHKQRGRE